MNPSLRAAACAALLAALAALAACTSAGTAAGRSGDAHPAPPVGDPVLDASYDWHGLIVVPFGATLNQSPVPLHEVLLFQDTAHPPPAETGDCYALEGAPPRFMGREPDHYLLCFEHDRMSRVEALVRLGTADAAPSFARGCALWLREPAAGAASREVCEGRDGDIAFSARLTPVTDDTEFTVFMTLALAAASETERAGSAPR